MDYRDQEKFLRGSRIWGAAVSFGLFAVAMAIRFMSGGRWHAAQTVVFALVAVAVAVLMYYTPDYLHLSVRPERKPHWEIKLRWRIAAPCCCSACSWLPRMGVGYLFYLPPSSLPWPIGSRSKKFRHRSWRSTFGSPIWFCSFCR